MYFVIKVIRKGQLMTFREEIAESASLTKLPVVALASLRSSGHLFNPEQQQRLVDTIAKYPRFAKVALLDIEQLTDDQREQLSKVLLAD